MSDQDIGRPPPPRNLSPNGHSHPSGDAESNTASAASGSGGGGGGGGGGRASTVPQEPEVVTIKLQKSNNGMGLSIVAARGVGQEKLGIYIKSVVKGGAADVDGRLQAGDQLLKVDGQSLVGITQEKAAELMTQTGPVVTLEVAKQGAIYHGLAALLSQPSPIMQRGTAHGGPRRLSERDIPSRLMHDPRMPTAGNHLLPPRIQGSKSVPALNSGHPNQEMIRAPSSNLQSHEVYNPGYSRTSSTTSIPKAMGYINSNQDAGRAHSTNNLRQEPPHEMNQRYPYPPPPQGSQAPPPYSASGSDVPMRPVSQQNFQQSMRAQPPPPQEERHYQNISLYQQQPNNYGARPSPQPYPPHLQTPRGHHGSHSSLQHSDHFQSGAQPQMDRVRPVSALISPREQEQYANSMGYPHTLPPQRPPPSPHRLQPPPYSLEPQGQQGFPQRPPESREYRGQQDSNQPYPDGDQQSIGIEPGQGGHPQRGYHQEPYGTYGGPPVHPHGMDVRHRDLIRQEAKMEEMREEVRRREERERSQQNFGQPGPQWGQPRTAPVSSANARYMQSNNYGISPHYGPGHPPQQPPRGPNVPPPPPPAKPRMPQPLPGEKVPRTYAYDPRYEGQPLHPVYRDSPPPAPPMGTHPLHPQQGHPQQQPGPPPPAVSYRYGPSGYPPRPGEPPNQRPSGQPMSRPPQTEPKPTGPIFRHTGPASTQNQKPGSDSQHSEKKEILSPSPWEREEKEKMCEGRTSPPPTTSPLLLQQQRLEEARRARDEEISELEDQPHRTLQQEERLRTLRLEQEFQRRAEESKGDDEDEDDEELLDRAESRERMLRMQEDLERTRQRRIEWEQNQLRQQQKPNTNQQEEWAKQNSHERQRSQLEEQEGRLRHLRLEEVTRKQELQAAKEAEERLLREARRRQEEDMKNQRNLQIQQGHSYSQPSVPTHTQQPATYVSSSQPSGHHRLESLISGHQDVPPPLPSSPPPPLEPATSQANAGSQLQYNHYPPTSAQYPAQSSGSQRLDKLLLTTAPSSYGSSQQSGQFPEKHSSGPPPPPPERKSSYEVTNQISSGSSGTRLPSSLRNGDSTQVHVAKKVSWNDTRFEVETNGNSNGSPEARESSMYNSSLSSTYNSAYEEDSAYTLEDIDEVLSTPGNSQQLNTYSTGSTPGVIGAQEVYRDPRQRIEAERQQMQQQEFKSAGPEKLSFREKMKMFAKETGEPNSPRDRMKISRAQRDIENNLNGT